MIKMAPMHGGAINLDATLAPTTAVSSSQALHRRHRRLECVYPRPLRGILELLDCSRHSQAATHGDVFDKTMS